MRQKEREEELRKQINFEIKEKQKNALEIQRRQVEEKIKREADSVKQEKQQ